MFFRYRAGNLAVMRYQRNPYSCGAAAVVNALRCHGRRVSEIRVQALAGTTAADGTGEQGIVAALRELGCGAASFETQSVTEAMTWLEGSMEEGVPVIVCTQQLQHWVTVIGMVGTRFVVVDPSNSKRNRAENGVHVVPRFVLRRSWQARDGTYFGIRCLPRTG